MNNTVKISTPSDREVTVERVFEAPRQNVFDALTKPELIKRWYGPEGWSLEVCEVDLKVEGKWRFVLRQPEGKMIAQFGVYKEIAPPARLVNTESWEDWNPGETLVTTALTEEDGKTTFTSTMLFPTQEVRDIVLKSGLKDTVGPMYQKLSEALASVN